MMNERFHCRRKVAARSPLPEPGAARRGDAPLAAKTATEGCTRSVRRPFLVPPLNSPCPPLPRHADCSPPCVVRDWLRHEIKRVTEHLRPKQDGRGTADGRSGKRLHSDKDSAVSVNLSGGSVLSEKRERADGSASVDYFFFTFLPLSSPQQWVCIIACVLRRCVSRSR